MENTLQIHAAMRTRPAPLTAHPRQAGFTLIELMVTVAIIGILAAVALPAYNDYITRGRIPDATSTLAAKQVRLEQFYQDNRKYNGANDCASDTASSQYFDFSCTASDASSYALQAVGKGAMTGFTYTVNQSGAKATTAVPSGWATSATCWITKKGGVC